ncbi:MAG: diguanylate cyclase [Lachnospiraceae bacterium]|nr:diguanylate cyclase [Lachnospiraceae bacterium]
MEKRTFQNYIDKIDAVRYLDSNRMLKLSKQMLSEAKQDKDECAQAWANYFSLEARYRLGKLDEKMLGTAAKVLQASRTHSMPELEAKILNMIGIFLLAQGDHVAALEYYQMAMEITKKHRYYGRVRVLNNNIGDIFMRMKQYKEALELFLKCYEQSVAMYEKKLATGKGEIGVYNINIAALNIAQCYCELGKHEESLAWLEKLIRDEEGFEENYYGSGKEVLYVRNYAKLGRFGQAEQYIENIIKAAEDGIEAIEMAEEYLSVCRILIEVDKLEQADRMLKAVHRIAGELNFSTLWCPYYETVIAYAKKKQNTAMLLAAYDKYMESQKKRDAFLEKQQYRGVKNRQALNAAMQKQKKAEQTQLNLKHLSEHDPLTGLYNRYVLNRESKRWWKRATAKESTVGVIVMDIDYFKQYNDTYGHLEGDACIKRVSDIIRDTIGSRGIVVRYGGDEFFILLQGRKTEEIIELSCAINSRLRTEKIPHNKSLVSSYVTVSQGIANGIPEQNQTMDDLTGLADNALYRAKEKRRGSIGVYENRDYRVITM